MSVNFNSECACYVCVTRLSRFESVVSQTSVLFTRVFFLCGLLLISTSIRVAAVDDQ